MPINNRPAATIPHSRNSQPEIRSSYIGPEYQVLHRNDKYNSEEIIVQWNGYPYKYTHDSPYNEIPISLYQRLALDPGPGVGRSQVVHGLWMQTSTKEGLFRDLEQRNTRVAEFKSYQKNQMTEKLYNLLIRYWPSNNGAHARFWQHEFTKHSPDAYSVSDYFTATLHLFDKLKGQCQNKLKKCNINIIYKT